MIEKVTVNNVYGRHLELELRHPEKSGYAVTGISGIEPMDVDIKTSQFVSGKKYRYNSGFHKLRTIGIAIIFYEYNNDHKTIETLRNELYNYFLTNEEVTLTFLKSGKYYSIKGVVDKNAPTIFSQQTGTTISVVCPELWFYLSDENGTAIESSVSINDINTQLCPEITYSNITTGMMTKSVTNGVATVKATNIYGNAKLTISGINNNDIVLMQGKVNNNNKSGIIIGLFDVNISQAATSKTLTAKNGWQNVSFVSTISNNTNAKRLAVEDTKSSGWDDIVFKEFELYNLTKRFGSTMANYILTLENTTPGAGVAYFNTLSNYYGTFETGFITKLTNTSNTLNSKTIIIDSKINDILTGSLRMYVKGLESGAELYISTMSESIEIYSIYNNVKTNRIDFLLASSMTDRRPLPVLKEGVNTISVYDETMPAITIPYTIDYNTLYRGL